MRLENGLEELELIYQRVASTLLNRGRCNAATVARLAGLTRATGNAALLILVQHNLVGSTGGSRRDPPEEEMYEFDVSECLLRLRWPRVLALTEDKFGDEVSSANTRDKRYKTESRRLTPTGTRNRAPDLPLRKAHDAGDYRCVQWRQEQ
jgi:DNA-directed RNA polymerase III subunit RPC3